MLHMGCTWATVFNNSGTSLRLTSAVAIHDTNTCSIVSLLLRQRSQRWETPGLSLAILSFVRKSQVRNFSWTRSFFTSCVVWISRRTGWGWSDKPKAVHLCTSFWSFLLLLLAIPFHARLWLSSWQEFSRTVLLLAVDSVARIVVTVGRTVDREVVHGLTRYWSYRHTSWECRWPCG